MWITTKFNVRNWFEKHLMCSLCSQSSMISLTRFHAGCLNVLLAQPREDKLHPCCILILIEDFSWHWGHSGSYCRFSLVLNTWPLKSIISPFFKIHYLLLLTSAGLHAVSCCHVVEKHYFLHCLGKQADCKHCWQRTKDLWLLCCNIDACITLLPVGITVIRLSQPLASPYRITSTDGGDGKWDVALLRLSSYASWRPLRIKTLKRGGYRCGSLHQHHR